MSKGTNTAYVNFQLGWKTRAEKVPSLEIHSTLASPIGSTAALFTLLSAIPPQLLNLIHYKDSPRVLFHSDTRKGHFSLLPVTMSHLYTARLFGLTLL